MKQRNAALDVLRVIFTAVVVLHHSGLHGGVLARGYMAVEFFFFVSGWLLAASCRSRAQEGTAAYMRRRLLQLYPPYLLAFLMMAGLTAFTGQRFPYTTAYAPALEALLLQNIGLPGGGGVNYPLWYLSVLVTASPFLHAAYRRADRRVFRGAAVGVIAAVYACLIAGGGVEHWDNVLLVLYPPFWRGAADLLAGMLLYDLSDRFAAPAPRLETGAAIASAVLIILPGPRLLDFPCAAALFLLLFAVTRPGARLAQRQGGRVLGFLARVQYAAFLLHAPVIVLVRALFSQPPRAALPYPVYVAVLFALLLALAAGLTALTDALRGRIVRRRAAR